MEIKELKKLASALYSTQKAGVASNFSVEGTVLTQEAMQETLRSELYELCKTRSGYEKNKWDLFDLISETIDAKMPKELENWFEGFVTINQFGENDKPEITLKKDSKNLRARKFITKVSPAGVYETFRLSKEGKFTIEMAAVGGAAQIAFEDFLTGRVDWNELLEVVSLGIQDNIYDEVLKTLEKCENDLPTANKAESTNFDAAALNRVLKVVSAYGDPIIYCTDTFAREITEGSDWASEEEKNARRNKGYLANYKNAKIVILPQSYTDETNSTTVVDDSKAYIFPQGREGIIQVALQGSTHVNEIPSQADWSKELHTYKKFGVAGISFNDICTYTITSLAE